MSQLRLSNPTWGVRYVNVLSFSAPMVGQISAAQTRTMVQHFPIKALQPELQVEVIFRSEDAYQDFQRYVRNTQVDAQSHDSSPGVSLYWAERSIYNWTGVIKDFQAGGRRANYTPRAKFTVDLVDSMMSSKTFIASISNMAEEIWGVSTPGGVLGSTISSAISDSLLTLPNIPGLDNVFGGSSLASSLLGQL